MKIIFMGTPDFAVGTLRSLAEAGHEITLVVSQPDKPKGRGHAMVPTPVKAVAEELEIPVFQPVKIREAKDVLEKTEADVCVVAAFGQIIPASILHMKKYGCINVHASLLPKYRGAAPIQWAVIDGEKESGVTIMQMDEGLDTGDMLAKAIVPLDEKETGGSLFDKLSEAGGRLWWMRMTTAAWTRAKSPRKSRESHRLLMHPCWIKKWEISTGTRVQS